jgi:hypothetical protein
MSYDIIGDIHGHAQTLKALLAKLGYTCDDGVYRHPSRRVVFLGDFIDRGPHQRETLAIVRGMTEGGSAMAVMANHEFNAIAYSTPDGEQGFMRPHEPKNAKQHAAFLDEFPPESAEYAEAIAWFKTLPLWLDLGPLRVIHACWDKKLIGRIQQNYGGACLTEELLARSTNKNCWEFAALEILLKGKEIPLPAGSSFKDSYGERRLDIRIRWWDQQATTYKSIFMGSPEVATHIPDDDIDGDHLIEYELDQPPVFLGHYWLQGEPELLEPHVACLDYSVAIPGGKLVAYRWNGEQTLTKEAFVWVDRVEP